MKSNKKSFGMCYASANATDGIRILVWIKKKRRKKWKIYYVVNEHETIEELNNKRANRNKA